MAGKNVNILFISDIVGRAGVDFVLEVINVLKLEYSVDFTICNGENAATGKGLTKKIAEDLFEGGVDVITSGNHLWEKPRFFEYLESSERVLRPLNYPAGCPGNGSGIFTANNGSLVSVLNLQGRTYMFNIDCPFRVGGKEIAGLLKKTKVVIVDFHAEATAEKQALGWYLDGKASAVIGTHTHVQTADERIFPNGLGYITDAGMTGSLNSVIGMKTDIAIDRFLYQIPKKMEISEDQLFLNGVFLQVDVNSGKTLKIERISMNKT